YLEGKEFPCYLDLVDCLKFKYNGQISKTTAQSRLSNFKFEFKDIEQEILNFCELVKLWSCEKNRYAKEKLLNCRKDYSSIQEIAADLACVINMYKNNSKFEKKKKIENFCFYCKKKGHIFEDCRKRLNLCLRYLKEKSSLFIVKVNVNGYSFNGLIDSGAETTVIPEKIVKQFSNLNSLPDSTVETIGQKINMKKITGKFDFIVDGFQGTLYETLLTEDVFSQFDGIIGIDLLKEMNVIIDIDNKILLPITRTKFKNVFYMERHTDKDLEELEDNLKIEISREFPDLNPESYYDCGNDIAVAPEQVFLDSKLLGIKFYSTPKCKHIQANIQEMLMYGIISKSQAVKVMPFYPIKKLNSENQPLMFKDIYEQEFIRMRALLDAREINNKTIKLSYNQNTALRIIQHLKGFSLSQGAVNSSIIFQRIMKLLSEKFKFAYEEETVQLEVYQDDILLLTNKNKEHHIKILKMLLKELQERKIKISVSKSKFLKTRIDYLSWTFEKDTVRPSESSILKLTNRKLPEKKGQLYQFLQSLCYFKITIKDWDILTRELYNICKGEKNEKIIWEEENKVKFNKIINILLEKPYLHLKRDDLPIIMVVDASKVAVGGYLYQEYKNNRLILGHFCFILGPCLKDRSATYLELKAIATGVETYKDLICGETLYVHSDHKPLGSLLNSKSITQPKHMELLCTIKQYVNEIHYIPGAQNNIADYISRCTLEKGRNNIDNFKNQIKQINYMEKVNSEEDEIMLNIVRDQKNLKEYDVMLNNIKYMVSNKEVKIQKDHLVIPINNEQTAMKIIKHTYDKYGHIIDKKTNEREGIRPELQTISYPDNVWEIVATDVCIIAQYEKIIQFIDTLSRFWIPKVLENLTSQETCNVAIRKVFSRFGTPLKIICDQGTNYKNFEFQNLCESLNIEVHYCTPQHKTGNSVCETSFRTMRKILMKIKNMIDDNNNFNFKDAVNYASFIYNVTECTTTKNIPFLLMFGRLPNTSDFINIGFKNNCSMEKLTEMRKTAKITSQILREKQNKNLNEFRYDPELKVGDLVLIKSNTATKIESPYEEPYEIKEINGTRLSLIKPENTSRGRPLIRNAA
ncbi:Reverse transcriptase domain and Integrase,catalytic core domain and Zinc finger, CCHC-type domain and Peptidase A2A, retrovirus, catalytic domain and Ribonuclease H-like domain and Peptidase A2A, retrovirus RVP subgroup domain and Aspartic peptidase domain-containing protein, partial [Strongyloides ratti]